MLAASFHRLSLVAQGGVLRLLNIGGPMSKITAILGSALFFVVAPAMLAGVIPWLITHWEFRPPF